MHKAILSAAFLLAVSVSAEAATIDPLPNVTSFRYGGQIYANTTSFNPYHAEGDVGGVTKDVTTTGFTRHSTSSSYSSVNINLSHAPSLFSVSEAGVFQAGSSSGKSGAFLGYYFTIAGPTATTVPVSVVAKGETSVEGPQTYATAFFKLEGAEGSLINQNLVGNDSFGMDQVFNLVSNREYLVSLDVETFAGNGAFSGSSLSRAMIDPFFKIDPAYSGYSLVFSNGINNTLVATTPLPASVILFGTALLALGVACKAGGRARGMAAA